MTGLSVCSGQKNGRNKKVVLLMVERQDSTVQLKARSKRLKESNIYM